MIPDGLDIGWIFYTLNIHRMTNQAYIGDFEKVLNFYKTTSAKQHQMFLRLISDKLTFFDSEKSESFEVDEEYDISFNGVYHQINIK